MTKLFVLDRMGDIALHQPRRPALHADGRSIDYGDLTATVTGLCDYLRGEGVGAEDVVATALPRGGNAIIAMLAIWMSGAAYLPIDVKWPERRRELVLSESVTFVLDEAEGAGAHGMPGEPGLRVRRRAEGKSRPRDTSASEQNLAYVIHTSGSTGTPSAVGVEFGAMDNYARYLHDLVKQAAVHADGDLRVLLSADLSFDASLRPVLLLAAGAALVIAPDLMDGSWQDHIDCIAANNVTILSGVPSWYSGLLGAGFRPGDSKVQLAFIGGEAVPNGVVRKLVPNGCTVVVQYGPTETAVAATGGTLASDEFFEPPIGEELPGVQIHLYKDDSLAAAAEGEPAYVYVGGAGVARGYLHNPRLTAERFVPNPSGPPGSRMFRTGDLARKLPRGGYSFLGRSDDQVKISGRRIELTEISSVLNRHPAVAQSVAFVHRDSAHPSLIACYVGNNDAQEPGVDANVRDYLASELPSYEVPAVIRRVESLPMTDHGKVDVDALARLVQPTETDTQADDDTDLTDVERRVIGIVRKTLDAHCSIDDDFFALGLTSLDSLNILAQIREDLGVRVRLRDFFQARTTRNLCKLIGDVN